MTITATTLGGSLLEATRDLRSAGIDQPALDARLLLAHALSIKAIDVVLTPERTLSDDERAALGTLLQRRIAREPVSRIIGWRWFRGRKFTLGPATLDPRPDSETLIDLALAFVRDHELVSAPLRILDVGTGTGCLLLTLLAELPAATGVGVDISADALSVAATNAANLGIGADRVTWKQGSAAERATGFFNIIVANPPYIPTSEIDNLDPEVQNFDPQAALDGGVDGLDCYRSWLPALFDALGKPLALLGFEVGAGQAHSVAVMVNAAAGTGDHVISITRDLGGIERCVSIITRSHTSRKV